MKNEKEILYQCFEILKDILLSSIETEYDKEIYRILKEANEVPVNYVPYWMADDLDDVELDNFQLRTDNNQENFENLGQKVVDYMDGVEPFGDMMERLQRNNDGC